jgi:hypothetical protein
VVRRGSHPGSLKFWLETWRQLWLESRNAALIQFHCGANSLRFTILRAAAPVPVMGD